MEESPGVRSDSMQSRLKLRLAAAKQILSKWLVADLSISGQRRPLPAATGTEHRSIWCKSDLSDLVRGQIDGLLGREVPMRDDAPHTLSVQQRLLPAQQYGPSCGSRRTGT